MKDLRVYFLISRLSKRRSKTGAKLAGQAMVEFVIALLAVIIVISGLTQFIELANERERLMGTVRGETGVIAFSGASALSSPDSIRDWEEGGDAQRHTADDRFSSGNLPGSLDGDILTHSVMNDDDWIYFNGKDNELVNLRTAPGVAAALGFVRHEKKSRIELMPATRKWIYDSDSVTVSDEVWLPVMKIR